MLEHITYINRYALLSFDIKKHTNRLDLQADKKSLKKMVLWAWVGQALNFRFDPGVSMFKWVNWTLLVPTMKGRGIVKRHY